MYDPFCSNRTKRKKLLGQPNAFSDSWKASTKYSWNVSVSVRVLSWAAVCIIIRYNVSDSLESELFLLYIFLLSILHS